MVLRLLFQAIFISCSSVLTSFRILLSLSSTSLLFSPTNPVINVNIPN